MIGNRKEGGRVCTILLHVIRISPAPCDNSWQQFWTEKSLSLSRSSDLACPDRIPSLYHLCFYHWQPCNCNLNSRIFSAKTIKKARASGSVNRKSHVMTHNRNRCCSVITKRRRRRRDVNGATDRRRLQAVPSTLLSERFRLLRVQRESSPVKSGS